MRVAEKRIIYQGRDLAMTCEDTDELFIQNVLVRVRLGF